MVNRSSILRTFQEVAEECKELNIGFNLELGEPNDILTKSYLAEHKIGLLVADYSPLRLVYLLHTKLSILDFFLFVFLWN